MDSLATRAESGNSDHHISIHNKPSKLNTYGFAIAIILGLSGLAVGITGLFGYFPVGALNNMSQIDAIIMMAAGGGGGAILFIIGIVGTIKNRPAGSCQPHDDTHANSRHKSTHQKSESTKKNDEISADDTPGGLIYGPEMWPELGKKWGCKLEILDAQIPEAPKEAVAKGKIRIYIPSRVRVNGKEKDFTLNTLIEMGGGPFEFCRPNVRDQFGNDTAAGWMEMDKNVMSESREEYYEAQKRMVEDKGCRMPSILEAVVLNLMVFAFTGKRLYGINPLSYVRCSNKIDHAYPVVVGAFGPAGLNVFNSLDIISDAFGTAALRKF